MVYTFQQNATHIAVNKNDHRRQTRRTRLLHWLNSML